MKTDLPFQSHSDTSRAAAESMEDRAHTLRLKVFEWLRANGPAIDERIQIALGMNPSTERPRRIELYDAGLVVDTGKRQKTSSGRWAVLWAIRNEENVSATGRNLEGNERNEHDFYATPDWATRAILPHLGDPKTILDPGSGMGAIARVCNQHWKDANIIGVEQEQTLFQNSVLIAQPPKLRFILGDFFLASHAYDLVIGNPPYGNAESFVEHALKIGKTVAFLLRINWLAGDPNSKKEHIRRRAALHKDHPADIYVLPRRPSFVGGSSDATEYAWFVWGEAPVQGGGWKPARGNRWFVLDIEKK